MAAYFASLNPTALWNAAPGGLAQGLIWGIMALGVYLTFRVLNFADLSVDGSFATGGAVAVMLILTVPALVKGRLSRPQGIALLCIYAAFCVVQFTI